MAERINVMSRISQSSVYSRTDKVKRIDLLTEIDGIQARARVVTSDVETMYEIFPKYELVHIPLIMTEDMPTMLWEMSFNEYTLEKDNENWYTVNYHMDILKEAFPILKKFSLADQCSVAMVTSILDVFLYQPPILRLDNAYPNLHLLNVISENFTKSICNHIFFNHIFSWGPCLNFFMFAEENERPLLIDNLHSTFTIYLEWVTTLDINKSLRALDKTGSVPENLFTDLSQLKVIDDNTRLQKLQSYGFEFDFLKD